MFWKKKPKVEAKVITDANFDSDVLDANVPVLLDFYADWCGPCKTFMPIVNELAKEFEGHAIVGKVNTEQNPKLSQYFKIKSLPTVVIIDKGDLVERFHGLVPKPNLVEILNDYIGGNK